MRPSILHNRASSARPLFQHSGTNVAKDAAPGPTHKHHIHKHAHCQPDPIRSRMHRKLARLALGSPRASERPFPGLSRLARPAAESSESIAYSRRTCQTSTRSIEWTIALQPRAVRAGLEALVGTQGMCWQGLCGDAQTWHKCRCYAQREVNAQQSRARRSCHRFRRLLQRPWRQPGAHEGPLAVRRCTSNVMRPPAEQQPQFVDERAAQARDRVDRHAMRLREQRRGQRAAAAILSGVAEPRKPSLGCASLQKPMRAKPGGNATM